VSDAATVGARPWRRALAWLAFLGPFFFATYGLATWATAQRAGVPSIVFAWERWIPFWPWTIVPYWVIDVLYAASLFVCSTRRELDTHAKRLLTAQVVAIAVFLIAPLRFSFVPPPVDGVAGAMFGVLRSFDQPFNQLPSLHLALAVILAALFARKTTGIARVAGVAGFVAIGLSVLTTWQHHFIDVPTGVLLGALCVWAWPFESDAVASLWQLTRDPARTRLALVYAAGAALAAVLAVALGGAALWALWIAVSLALVAVAYAALGAGAFQKGHDGRLSLAARWLYAPYLAGAWVNSRAWTRRTPDPVAVADGVFVGRVPTARELAGSPFAAVVDVTAEFGVDPVGRAYALVPMLDLATPTPDELRRAAHAIERLRSDGPLLVCCALGRSRSACAVAAWLISTGRVHDAATAVAVVRARQREAVLGERHVTALAGMAA